MQLNIYIPKEKSNVLEALTKIAEITKRPKNEIVLEAIEKYLPSVIPASLGKFSLGFVKSTSRADIYERRTAN